MTAPPQAGPLTLPPIEASSARRDGDRLVVASRPSVPLVQVRALLRGPGGAAARLAAACLLRDDRARALVDEVGATAEVHHRPDGLLVTACVEPQQAEAAVDLLLQLLRPGQPPRRDVVEAETVRLASLESGAASDPGESTRRAALRRAFGCQSPFAEQLDGQVTALGPEQVQDWHAQSGPAVVVLCGQVDPGRDWGDPRVAGAEPERAEWRPPTEVRWRVADRPGSAQTTLRAVAPFPAPGTSGRAAAAVAERLLGGSGKGNRLIHELRERRGFGYHPGTSVVDLTGASYVLLEVDVATEVTAVAVSVVDEVLGSLSAQPPDERELELGTRGVVGNLARATDAQGSLADLLLAYAVAGVGPAAVTAFAQEVAGTPVPAVAAAAAGLLHGLHGAAAADVSALEGQPLPATWGSAH